jgi:hypothetical protein
VNLSEKNLNDIAEQRGWELGYEEGKYDMINEMKKTTDPCSFETGVRGGIVFLRTKVDGTEAYSELELPPDTARFVARQLLAQADIISPCDKQPGND